MPLTWTAELDPHELKDYTNSWQAELSATSDTLDTSTFILPSDAIAAGLEISSQGSTEFGGTVFFEVATEFQTDPMFDDPTGTMFRIRHQIETTGGRRLEISIYLKVMQR